MTKVILRYGIIGGLIVAVPWMAFMLTLPADGHFPHSMVLGYTLMLIALSTVFVGVKHYRDQALGGVIGFGKAFLLGLGISLVASLVYVIGWEIDMAYSKFDFIAAYAKMMGGDTPEAKEFVQMYSKPLVRMCFTFIEIFPVGVLVSMVSAGLLRNSRLFPARAP